MRLIIVGSGRCVWDDLDLIPIDSDVMAVNDMIMHFPFKLTHAYSVDQYMLNAWVQARRPEYKKRDGKIRLHCPFPCENAELQDLKVQANSGINAIYCALDLGYTDIKVCGVPLSSEGHYFDPPWVKTPYETTDHLQYCNFDERVEFMSGRGCR